MAPRDVDADPDPLQDYEVVLKPTGERTTPRGLWARYTRTKSVEDVSRDAETSELSRELGAGDLVVLGVGGMIGAGIFVAVGSGAALAGPAVAISYAVAATACIFAALCYAEMAASVPAAGMAYSYTFVSLGQLMAWLIAWNLMAEYMIGNVAVAAAWSDNLEFALARFGLDLPVALTGAPGTVDGAVFDLPAFLIVVAVTLLLTVGVRESATTNLILSALKLGALFLFLALGAAKVDTSLWTDFSPEGGAGIFAGAAFVFFAFIGFDAVAAAAEESKDPRRDLPIGIIGSLVAVTVIYVLISLVYVGLVPWNAEPSGAALAVAMQNAGYSLSIGGVGVFEVIVALGAVAATTSVLLVFQLGVPRILMTLSRDKLLPEGLGKVHERFHTPARLTLLTGGLTAVGAAVIPFGNALAFTNLATLFVFAIVAVAVLALRRTRPELERPFRIKAAPVVVLVAVVALGGLMIALGLFTWLLWGVWMGIGLLLYGLYGARRGLNAEG